MVNVATGAAKENRTVDSVVVPNSDVTLDRITQSGALSSIAMSGNPGEATFIRDVFFHVGTV